MTKEACVTLKEFRAFFELVAKYWFLQHPYSPWPTLEDAIDDLRFHFRSRAFTTSNDRLVVIPRELLTGEDYREIINEIEVYCIDHYFIFPNESQYITALRSGDSKESKELMSLRDQYVEKKKINLPVWRRPQVKSSVIK